jgi:hypothetical protein
MEKKVVRKRNLKRNGRGRRWYLNFAESSAQAVDIDGGQMQMDPRRTYPSGVYWSRIMAGHRHRWCFGRLAHVLRSLGDSQH